MPVFCFIDIIRICSKDLCPPRFLETERDVLRKLTANTNNNSRSTFQLVDIHNTLVREFLKVELVRCVEIR